MTENEVQSINNPFNWIEEAISKGYFRYYEYENFSNFKEIGNGSFGKVCRANWKKSEQYFALKSFFIFNNTTAKEIIREVINYYYYHSFFYILQSIYLSRFLKKNFS
jgi:hypothetical protein